MVFLKHLDYFIVINEGLSNRAKGAVGWLELKNINTAAVVGGWALTDNIYGGSARVCRLRTLFDYDLLRASSCQAYHTCTNAIFPDTSSPLEFKPLTRFLQLAKLTTTLVIKFQTKGVSEKVSLLSEMGADGIVPRAPSTSIGGEIPSKSSSQMTLT